MLPTSGEQSSQKESIVYIAGVLSLDHSEPFKDDVYYCHNEAAYTSR